MKMQSIFISVNGFVHKPRFDTEAKGNSDMGYFKWNLK